MRRIFYWKKYLDIQKNESSSGGSSEESALSAKTGQSLDLALNGEFKYFWKYFRKIPFVSFFFHPPEKSEIRAFSIFWRFASSNWIWCQMLFRIPDPKFELERTCHFLVFNLIHLVEFWVRDLKQIKSGLVFELINSIT